jgi:tetratricopeptide (TPR) repeat protein
MTEPGANLPEEIRRRIEGRMREAIDSEIRALGEIVSQSLDARLADRRSRLEELTGGRKREAEEASVKELAALQAFGEETLKRLDAELIRKRTERLKEENARRETRLLKEKQEEEKKRLKAEEEAARRKAAEEPALKIRTALRKAQSHMDRGDLELASQVISEGLEIDGFNAELLDLDAKIREAMASDTFSTSSSAAADQKKGKDKGKEKGKDKQKSKAQKPKKPRPEQQTSAASPPGAPAPRKFPAWAFTVIAAVLIAGAALIAWLEYEPKRADEGITLAVLPWSPPAGADDLRLFASALPEILVKVLSAGPSATGILGYSTTSGLASLGSDPAVSLVRLGYSHFLRGAISRRDSVFTVKVELSDSAGESLWSAEYVRDTAGLLLVPYEVAHGLRGQLRESTLNAAGTAVEVTHTHAYLLYLAGLNAMHERGAAGVDNAIGAFSGAVAVDSGMADAYAGLAVALVSKHELTEPGAGDLLSDARTAALRSIDLAPGSAEGYFAITRVLIEQRDFPGAIGMLDSATAHSPADCRLPYLRGLAFFRSGRQQQALDVLQKAYALDPRNPDVLDLLATVHQVERTFDRALWFRETAMHFSGDSLRYFAGPFADLIIHDPTLALSSGDRVTSACLLLLERDPRDYMTLYSLARMLQGSGKPVESLTYFNGLETALRTRIKENPNDTRARMYLALTLVRLGRYVEGTTVGEAAAAADTNNVEAKYLLARVYALQMYSPQTRQVDGVKQSRAVDLLKQALLRRFIDAQICSADLYNIYNHGDVRSLIQ